eukprot:ANDGO_05753.mRNA.1 hypothetical protein
MESLSAKQQEKKREEEARAAENQAAAASLYEEMLASELHASIALRQQLETEPSVIAFRAETGAELTEDRKWWCLSRDKATQIEVDTAVEMEMVCIAKLGDKIALLTQYAEYFAEQAELIKSFVEAQSEQE